MPEFLKNRGNKSAQVQKIKAEIKFTAEIEAGAENNVTNDLQYIAETLSASEINTIRKVCSNNILKKMALEYASRYI